MAKPKSNTSINIPATLIKELLTDSELRMVKNRLLVIKLLIEGLSIREVAKRAKVGTDTVMRILKKYEESPALKEAFKKSAPLLSTSKWIFGSVDLEK